MALSNAEHQAAHRRRQRDRLAEALAENARLRGEVESLKAQLGSRIAAVPPEPPPPDVDESIITTIERGAPKEKRRKEPAGPRCSHAGVRVTGGWCPVDQRQVLPGGRFA